MGLVFNLINGMGVTMSTEKTNGIKNNNKEYRPRLNIIPDKIDEAINLAGYTMLVLWTGLLSYSYAVLPDHIPVHFNLAGTPDSYAGKESLLLLLGIGVVLFILLSYLLKIPHYYNYIVTITPENAEYQYRNSVRLLRLLRVFIPLVFAGLQLLVLFTSLQKSLALPLFIVYGALVLIALTIAVHIGLSVKKK